MRMIDRILEHGLIRDAVDGASTTLSEPVTAGATAITVTSDEGMVAGRHIRVGTCELSEERTVASSYNGGTRIPLTVPLFLAHDSGEAVVERERVMIFTPRVITP